MRTMRLYLAGTVTLAPLGGLGSVALAQPGTGSVHVTGTVGGSQTGSGTIAFTDQAIQYRGSAFVGPLAMSDPRLTGVQRSTWNYDELLPAGNGTVISGLFGVENDDGSWTGTFSGVEYPGGSETLVQGWLVGEGAYDGLSAYLSYVLPHVGTMTVEGMIFSGEMPSFPEPPAQ